ncbi:hypothetical protein ACQZV8_21720, partial [Magnetococcales bacterium HHB-1]
MKTLFIFYNLTPRASDMHHEVISFEEIKKRFFSRHFYRHLFHYPKVILRYPAIHYLHSPFRTAFFIWCLSFKEAWFQNDQGFKQRITLPYLLYHTLIILKDLITRSYFLQSIREQLKTLDQQPAIKHPPLKHQNPALFLQTNIHATPFFNQRLTPLTALIKLREEKNDLLIAPETIQRLEFSITKKHITPDSDFTEFPYLNLLKYNTKLIHLLKKENLENKAFAFIYTPYTPFNFTTIHLSQKLNLPFILEYIPQHHASHTQKKSPLEKLIEQHIEKILFEKAILI